MTTNRAEWTHPDLQSLAGLFFEDGSGLGEFCELPAEQLAQPWSRLLAHTHHMTVTLEQHHASPVEVEVLDRHSTATHYARKIRLRRQSDGRVVLFGIVRLARFTLAPDVMGLIESESAPLGRILIEKKVMRKVKLMSVWEIRSGNELRELLELPDLATCYGRTALIYADGMPAVELLEVIP